MGGCTADAYPDWVQIIFNGSKTIERVVVYTLQDTYTSPVEPTDSMTFSKYGITDFTVRVGTAPLGDAGKGERQQPGQADGIFEPAPPTGIRVKVNSALGGFSRITEIEAWGN